MPQEFYHVPKHALERPEQQPPDPITQKQRALEAAAELSRIEYRLNGAADAFDRVLSWGEDNR